MKEETRLKIDADTVKLMESVKLPNIEAFKALSTKNKCLGVMVFAFAVGDTRVYNMASNYYKSLQEIENIQKQINEYKK